MASIKGGSPVKQGWKARHLAFKDMPEFGKNWLDMNEWLVQACIDHKCYKDDEDRITTCSFHSFSKPQLELMTKKCLADPHFKGEFVGGYMYLDKKPEEGYNYSGTFVVYVQFLDELRRIKALFTSGLRLNYLQ